MAGPGRPRGSARIPLDPVQVASKELVGNVGLSVARPGTDLSRCQNDAHDLAHLHFVHIDNKVLEGKQVWTYVAGGFLSKRVAREVDDGLLSVVQHQWECKQNSVFYPSLASTFSRCTSVCRGQCAC